MLGAAPTHEHVHRFEQALEVWRHPFWEEQARDAFLRGYFRESASGKHATLPSTRENADRLLALFETEKIFYELQYELDHRPDWVWIPLNGIAKLAT